MYIFLPYSMNGLPRFEEGLTSERLTALMDSAWTLFVKVIIPKFKMDRRLPLKQLLAEMGMNRMFTGSADLSGIARDRPLFVSDVIHKAFIEVLSQC